jgi:hypothetical protein
MKATKLKKRNREYYENKGPSRTNKILNASAGNIGKEKRMGQ